MKPQGEDTPAHTTPNATPTRPQHHHAIPLFHETTCTRGSIAARPPAIRPSPPGRRHASRARRCNQSGPRKPSQPATSPVNWPVTALCSRPPSAASQLQPGVAITLHRAMTLSCSPHHALPSIPSVVVASHAVRQAGRLPHSAVASVVCHRDFLAFRRRLTLLSQGPCSLPSVCLVSRVCTRPGHGWEARWFPHQEAKHTPPPVTTPPTTSQQSWFRFRWTKNMQLE